MSSESGSSAATALTHFAAFHEGFSVTENKEMLRRALRRGEDDTGVRAHIQTTRAVMASRGRRPLERRGSLKDAVHLARAAGQAQSGNAAAAQVKA